MNEIFDPVSRPLWAAIRFVLWLAWEVLVLRVPWYVGWPLWRVVTLGRYPETAIEEPDEAGTLETVLVWGVGFLVLCGLSWAVSKAVTGP